MKLTEYEQNRLNDYNNQIQNIKDIRASYLKHIHYQHKMTKVFYKSIKNILVKMETNYKLNHKLTIKKFKILIKHIQNNMDLPDSVYTKALNTYLNDFRHVKNTTVKPKKIDNNSNREQFFNYESTGINNKINQLKKSINLSNLYFGKYANNHNIDNLLNDLQQSSDYQEQTTALKSLIKVLKHHPSFANANIITKKLINTDYINMSDYIYLHGRNIIQNHFIQTRVHVLRQLIHDYYNLGITYPTKDAKYNHKVDKAMKQLRQQIKMLNYFHNNYVIAKWKPSSLSASLLSQMEIYQLMPCANNEWQPQLDLFHDYDISLVNSTNLITLIKSILKCCHITSAQIKQQRKKLSNILNMHPTITDMGYNGQFLLYPESHGKYEFGQTPEEAKWNKEYHNID